MRATRHVLPLLVALRAARFRQVAVVLLATLVLEACTSWVHETRPVPELVASHPGKLLRVTRSNGTVQKVVRPTLARDTLFGTRGFPRASSVTIPLTEIRAVQMQHFTIWKTIVFGAAVYVALIVMGAISFAGSTL